MNHVNLACQLLQATTPLAQLLLLVPLLLLLGHSISRSRHGSKQQQPKRRLPHSPPALPIIGHLHLVGDRPHVSLRGLAAKHGGGGLMFLRLGTVPCLVVSSPHAAQQVLRTHDHAIASRPASKVADALFYGSTNIGFSPYGEHWRQLRRLVTTHLLSVKKVNSYRDARRDEVRLVMDKIREAAAAGKAVDISETMNTFANDIVCRAVSGKFFREEGRNKLFREMIETNIRLIDGFNLQEYFPGLANALGSITGWFASNKTDKSRKRWDGLLETIITDHEGRRRSSEHGRVGGGVEQEDSDFIDVLLSVQKEYGITRDHIKAILMDMFSAGTDTSSLVLELAMAQLMRNPQLMAKLQDEVRVNTPKGQEMVAEDDIASMTYLRAVVKETLRLHPPAPLLLPHLSMVDCEVDGYTIPSGTRVIINEWAIGRDPESWEKPEEFMPERFTEGGSAAAVDFRGNDFQFVPFGAGRRICPGLNFGMATVEIMLANLVYWFDWELPAGMEKEDIDLTEVFGLTVHPKQKLILVPKLRAIGVHALQVE
ncbi:indole-2-monooxygenase-like [Panicum miliaceum]|uniref:Indole-2-monooxygenase-like n=1 Tax=Panicum miliaceum TaxID=4540 RepID=A0A3L6RGV9_PANMI|nr:indole-2-monooxygenase-like [Panicum miliaceum]